MKRTIDLNVFIFPSLMVFAISLVIGACAHASGESTVITPSILNQAKDDFNNKIVIVEGWMRIDFENYNIWQSKEANARGSFAKDCVSLMIPSTMNLERFDKHYVQIEGVFLKKIPENVVLLGGCNMTAIKVREGVEPTILKP